MGKECVSGGERTERERRNGGEEREDWRIGKERGKRERNQMEYRDRGKGKRRRQRKRQTGKLR